MRNVKTEIFFLLVQTQMFLRVLDTKMMFKFSVLTELNIAITLAEILAAKAGGERKKVAHEGLILHLDVNHGH